MNNTPDILCIGSVLWNLIGPSKRSMLQGSDVPGRIRQLPVGVALNIAMTLRRFDLHPTLIAAIADAHSLEAAGEKILKPLQDGMLGSFEAHYGGMIAA